MFLSILARNVGIKMVIGILCHTWGGKSHLNSPTFSIIMNLLLVAEANINLLWSRCLKHLMRKVTLLSIFTWSILSSFFPFQLSQTLSMRMYSVFYSLTFFRSSTSFFGERFLLYQQPCQLALPVNLQLYHILSTLSHYLSSLHSK